MTYHRPSSNTAPRPGETSRDCCHAERTTTANEAQSPRDRIVTRSAPRARSYITKMRALVAQNHRTKTLFGSSASGVEIISADFLDRARKSLGARRRPPDEGRAPEQCHSKGKRGGS
eukprot:1782290-Prymnesium_polylepis.1